MFVVICGMGGDLEMLCWMTEGNKLILPQPQPLDLFASSTNTSMSAGEPPCTSPKLPEPTCHYHCQPLLPTSL